MQRYCDPGPSFPVGLACFSELPVRGVVSRIPSKKLGQEAISKISATTEEVETDWLEKDVRGLTLVAVLGDFCNLLRIHGGLQLSRTNRGVVTMNDRQVARRLRALRPNAR